MFWLYLFLVVAVVGLLILIADKVRDLNKVRNDINKVRSDFESLKQSVRQEREAEISWREKRDREGRIPKEFSGQSLRELRVEYEYIIDALRVLEPGEGLEELVGSFGVMAKGVTRMANKVRKVQKTIADKQKYEELNSLA
jgi:uncharacterized membrane-anchored protein YhcB (DUF1043 family)